MKREQGFTVIEIIVVILFLAAATTILLIQKGNLSAANRDSQRKVAINAMYYNLEEVYYEANNSYPAKIDSKTLRAMDPELFRDTNGVAVGEADSQYRYEGINCDNNKCKGYSLRASLEKEDDYVKNNRND